MSIIKRIKANYGAVPREAMDGKHMSLKAKGLLAYLLCMPDNWQIYVSELANHHKEHKDTIAKAINELIDSGYVVREQVRENGRFRGYDYSVYDYQVTAKTVNGKTISEKTVYGKSNTNKIDSTKKDNTKKERESKKKNSPPPFIEENRTALKKQIANVRKFTSVSELKEEISKPEYSDHLGQFAGWQKLKDKQAYLANFSEKHCLKEYGSAKAYWQDDLKGHLYNAIQFYKAPQEIDWKKFHSSPLY